MRELADRGGRSIHRAVDAVLELEEIYSHVTTAHTLGLLIIIGVDQGSGRCAYLATYGLAAAILRMFQRECGEEQITSASLIAIPTA